MTRGYDFDAIKQNYPLDEVIGRTLKLRKSAGWYEGLCPFHNESTPSLKFKENDESWHCFGCGEHGDVIDFVAKVEHVTTQEAIARLTGGQAIELSEADRQKRREWLAEEDRKADAARLVAIAAANRRWERAKPVDGLQQYLERKHVAPSGARMEGENLLVPMWDSEGEVVNVQSIAPDGTKRFHTGCPTVGARFYIGIGWGRTIICEGFATGASVYEATADKVVVAFSQGQMENIAREMMAAGLGVVIAADRKALDAMTRLGDALGVPVIAPPLLASGDDFNDQMIEQGVDAVAATFRQGLIDYANKPEPAPAPPACSISFLDAVDFLEEDIPLRPWIVPGAILAGSTHILAAPGGTGKSVFTLQLALALASGEEWAHFAPKRQCRVLIINAEDDIPEQRRRMAGARTAMGIDTTAIRGRIMVADNPASILTSTVDPVRKSLVSTPLVGELRAIIEHHKIDVVFVDPFAETFDGDENSNGDTKWAMKTWRDEIARPTGAAVYLVHHTTKGSEDKAGSADVIRGGGAIVNSVRLAATLFVMSKAEAEDLGVREDQRFRYVRYDDAKSNNSLLGGRSWFQKVSVALRNGPDGDSDGGDEVGALMPFHFQGVGAYDPEAVKAVLKAVEEGYVTEDGICTDLPFTPSRTGGSKRWVGHLIAEMMGVDDKEAGRILTTLRDRKALVEMTYHDTSKGRDAKGLKVEWEAAKGLFRATPKD